MKGFEVLSPKWDVFIKAPSQDTVIYGEEDSER